jgi:hypothetical protein
MHQGWPLYQLREARREKLSYSHAQRLIYILGTTYSCESLRSTLRFIKLKYSSVLTDEHTTDLVRTALIE